MRASLISLVVLLTVSTLAWAFELEFPQRTKINATVVTDEAGNILFGMKPGQVEISGNAVVTLYGVSACPPDATVVARGTASVFWAISARGGGVAGPVCNVGTFGQLPNGSLDEVPIGDCVICRL